MDYYAIIVNGSLDDKPSSCRSWKLVKGWLLSHRVRVGNLNAHMTFLCARPLLLGNVVDRHGSSAQLASAHPLLKIETLRSCYQERIIDA